MDRGVMHTLLLLLLLFTVLLRNTAGWVRDQARAEHGQCARDAVSYLSKVPHSAGVIALGMLQAECSPHAHDAMGLWVPKVCSPAQQLKSKTQIHVHAPSTLIRLCQLTKRGRAAPRPECELWKPRHRHGGVIISRPGCSRAAPLAAVGAASWQYRAGSDETS